MRYCIIPFTKLNALVILCSFTCIQFSNEFTHEDVGICSIIKPQLNFNESLEHLPYWIKLFKMNAQIQPGSEVGKANGLTILLDAETYDYTYHLRAGEGVYIKHMKITKLGD